MTQPYARAQVCGIAYGAGVSMTQPPRILQLIPAEPGWSVVHDYPAEGNPYINRKQPGRAHPVLPWQLGWTPVIAWAVTDNGRHVFLEPVVKHEPGRLEVITCGLGDTDAVCLERDVDRDLPRDIRRAFIRRTKRLENYHASPVVLHP